MFSNPPSSGAISIRYSAFFRSQSPSSTSFLVFVPRAFGSLSRTLAQRHRMSG